MDLNKRTELRNRMLEHIKKYPISQDALRKELGLSHGTTVNSFLSGTRMPQLKTLILVENWLEQREEK